MDPLESQDNFEESSQGQEEVTGEAPVAPEGTGMNPAWNPLLETLPSSLHSLVTPHLSKWDQNFQSKVQEVHSQYEPYKPYLEQNISPDNINYALNIMRAIEERPEDMLKALQAYIGADSDEQGQVDPQQDNNGPDQSPEWMNHPEFKKTQEMVNTMAQLLVQQRQSQQQAAVDSELDQDLNAAKQTHGEYDEEWVLTKLYNNPDMTVDDAVKAYKQFENQILTRNRQPGPPVMGAGGSVPTQGFNPKNLDDKGRRSVVAQMLQQAANQNQ